MSQPVPGEIIAHAEAVRVLSDWAFRLASQADFHGPRQSLLAVAMAADDLRAELDKLARFLR